MFSPFDQKFEKWDSIQDFILIYKEKKLKNLEPLKFELKINPTQIPSHSETNQQKPRQPSLTKPSNPISITTVEKSQQNPSFSFTIPTSACSGNFPSPYPALNPTNSA